MDGSAASRPARKWRPRSERCGAAAAALWAGGSRAKRLRGGVPSDGAELRERWMWPELPGRWVEGLAMKLGVMPWRAPRDFVRCL